MYINSHLQIIYYNIRNSNHIRGMGDTTSKNTDTSIVIEMTPVKKAPDVRPRAPRLSYMDTKRNQLEEKVEPLRWYADMIAYPDYHPDLHGDELIDDYLNDD